MQSSTDSNSLKLLDNTTPATASVAVLQKNWEMQTSGSDDEEEAASTIADGSELLTINEPDVTDSELRLLESNNNIFSPAGEKQVLHLQEDQNNSLFSAEQEAEDVVPQFDLGSADEPADEETETKTEGNLSAVENYEDETLEPSSGPADAAQFDAGEDGSRFDESLVDFFTRQQRMLMAQNINTSANETDSAAKDAPVTAKSLEAFELLKFYDILD